MEASDHVSAASSSPLLSIIIPFYNEGESVVAVLTEVRETNPEAEIIGVDDGSTDDTWEKLRGLARVRGLRLTANRGQSAALYAGLRVARGEVCVTMDGDGQNDPADIPRLIDRWRQGDVEVVCGYRATRRDTLNRRVASRLANGIRRRFLHDGVRDTGCSLKVFPRSAVEHLVPFNGLHRYLPAIFLKAGLRLAELPVNHRPRTAGTSKYTNWDRALRGIRDLFGVSWLLSRKIHYPPITDTAPHA
jgi:dolichol-phosphate mannosyltransferase